MSSNLLFQLLVTQTMQVIVLVGVVLSLTKFFAKDRPHLAHALWALVLLKCMMPPIIASPTSPFSWICRDFATTKNSGEAQNGRNRLANPGADLTAEGLTPLIVQITPNLSARDTAEQGMDTSSQLFSKQEQTNSLVSFALYAWGSIAAVVFAVNALRLRLFLKRVEKSTLPTSPKLLTLIASLSKQVGLRRRVRVRIVDAAIGPAVVGLIWPTVLLPRVIVEGKSDSELEPLLAHELIHIRRGDLVWAMFQGLSTSLWWFNPLVWLADRRLTREAEQSCDEETIASLGCSPAVYARSLLDVMERKHLLRVAPSLPGVRPVDITANRLERIMRLGQGCYRQRPWWVVIVWLIGCAITLPGAAWVVAQEKSKEPKSAAREVIPLSGKVPSQASGDEGTEHNGENKFHIADVLDRLCKDRNLSKDAAESELLQLLQPVVPPTAGDSPQTVAEPQTKPIHKATLSIQGEQLHAIATKDQLKQIERSIESFRKFGFRRVTTEISFYELPWPLVIDELAFERGELQWREGDEVKSDLGLTGRLSAPMKTGSFDEQEVVKFKRQVEQDPGLKCTLCPRITSYSGQRASIQMGETLPFTVAYKEVKSLDGKTEYQPVVEKRYIGLEVDIRAVVQDPPKDGAIMLSCDYRRSRIQSVIKSNQSIPNSSEELAIENPIVQGSYFSLGCPINEGQFQITVATFENKTCITAITCQIADAKVAAAPPAVLKNLPEQAHVSVSDSMAELEVALLKYQSEQLGIRDHRLQAGKMAMNILEKWKDRENAFQELRSNRNSTADAASTKSEPKKKFSDGEVVYTPIPMLGPTIQEKWMRKGATVLDKLPYINRLFKNTELLEKAKPSEPSEDEVLQALEKDPSTKGSTQQLLKAGQIKITTKKIKDFSEPMRFVPLLGDAILHHSHYKCLLQDAATQEIQDTAYVDFQQFELAAEIVN